MLVEVKVFLHTFITNRYTQTQVPEQNAKVKVCKYILMVDCKSGDTDNLSPVFIKCLLWSEYLMATTTIYRIDFNHEYAGQNTSRLQLFLSEIVQNWAKLGNKLQYKGNIAGYPLAW